MMQDKVEDFFHTVSQAIPFIILILVIVAFSLRYDVFKTPSGKTLLARPLVKPSVVPFQKTVIQNGKQFNPSKSFTCLHISKDASVSAYRKDNSLFVQNKEGKSTSFYLLQGDCFYVWKYGQYTGQKTCGVGQYVSIANMLLSSGIGDISTLMNFIPKEISTASQSAMSLQRFKDIIKSCKNSEVRENKMFDVPKNISFKEIKK